MTGAALQGGAALPLYDWPELRDATDALWAALGARLREVGLPAPEALDRDTPAAALWADPQLLFSQTCGLPHVAGAARATRLICTPSYDAEGCGSGRYSSAIVARRGAAADLDALRGGRFAANGSDSLSGWAALLDAMEPAAIGEVVWTGAHRASVLAVAEGRADAAAIDALCWDMAQRFEPAAKELVVLGWTRPAPAPPFVTSALTASGDRARIRAALVETLVDPETATIRAELRLSRIVAFADTDYDDARALARLVRVAETARPELREG
ncbi:MAG: phosphate ABC transporter substrate-binding protein [Rhodobacteraceae bacterium]|nr:phosphate ABC transporter substrate-binding protein [Paracoccaceae bacterium]MBR27482.1 phosphate ABC transporter substrate-binding protein [Paracoccaceae bacterium]